MSDGHRCKGGPTSSPPVPRIEPDIEAIAHGLGQVALPKAKELGDGTLVVPLLGRDRLDAQQVEALKKMVEWRRGGASFPINTCDLERSALPLFRLGQVALYTAEGAKDLEQVRAVLALALRLRRRGLLIDLAIGATLAARAASWSVQRKVPLPAQFERYRPAAAEIHATLARDGGVFRSPVGRRRRCLPSSSTRARWAHRAATAPSSASCSRIRERQVYRDFHGRVLEEAHAVRDDWRKMQAVYEKAVAARPKSLLLAATILQPNLIERVGKEIDEYDQLLPRSKK